MSHLTPQQVEQAKAELAVAQAAVAANNAVLAAAGVALEVRPVAAPMMPCGRTTPRSGSYTVKESFACIGFPHNKQCLITATGNVGGRVGCGDGPVAARPPPTPPPHLLTPTTSLRRPSLSVALPAPQRGFRDCSRCDRWPTKDHPICCG